MKIKITGTHHNFHDGIYDSPPNEYGHPCEGVHTWLKENLGKTASLVHGVDWYIQESIGYENTEWTVYHRNEERLFVLVGIVDQIEE